MISRSVKSALLCLCVSSAFVCAAPAYAAGTQEAGTVSVSGYAEEQITGYGVYYHRNDDGRKNIGRGAHEKQCCHE